MDAAIVINTIMMGITFPRAAGGVTALEVRSWVLSSGGLTISWCLLGLDKLVAGRRLHEAHRFYGEL